MNQLMKAIQRLLLPAIALLAGPLPRLGAQDVCARVKIQIEQELTFEREAFEARMTITNGLPETGLTDLTVTVNFADEAGEAVIATSDPNNLAAQFFIRLQDGSSIPSSIASGSAASIKWLIIPSAGAGGSRPGGVRYLVGAEVNYKVGGSPEKVTVAPDTISVKPMPRLTLDYFLPSEVNGDDPFTAFIEEPEPFSLGVRIKNTGFGPATKLKIDSSQPKIVENTQGLLVAFRLHGCSIDDQPAAPTLLADFGTIPGGSTKTGRWVMTSSLYGRFIEFNASFSHADDLGGRLTSLIEKVNARLMVSDVLVDLAGRDTVRDFLAYTTSARTELKVWESSGVETEVSDVSAGSAVSGSGSTHVVTNPGATGSLYLKKADPNNGRRKIVSVTRADGKSLSPVNSWLSKTYIPGAQRYNYFLNVFDTGNAAGHAYTMVFEDVVLANRKPRMIDPGNRIFSAGATFEMLVLADDPDADALTITASSLPTGATFTKVNEGVSALRWAPTAAQVGDYTVGFTVSDGLLEDRKNITITVTDDPFAIAWRSLAFGPDARPFEVFFAADDDGDGMDNGLEYALNKDPRRGDESSIVMRIELNAADEMVTTLTYVRRTDDPNLEVEVVGSDSSRDTGPWVVQPQAVDPDQGGVPDGMQRWKSVDSVPISASHPRRFLRVRAKVGAP